MSTKKTPHFQENIVDIKPIRTNAPEPEAKSTILKRRQMCAGMDQRGNIDSILFPLGTTECDKRKTHAVRQKVNPMITKCKGFDQQKKSLQDNKQQTSH
jgi:hypothetical protein